MVAHRDAGGLRALAAQRRAHGQVQGGARMRSPAARPPRHPGAAHVEPLSVIEGTSFIVDQEYSFCYNLLYLVDHICENKVFP